jgi:hypothetical protein
MCSIYGSRFIIIHLNIDIKIIAISTNILGQKESIYEVLYKSIK